MKSNNEWVIDPNPFHFKQFTVHHHRSAFKVNTDGVLLASWANVEGDTILDIGTGSGVLALIAAQRNQDAIVDAIDIDEYSCIQAAYNFQLSKYESRLGVTQSSIADYSSDSYYSSMLCNPPFHINSTTPSKKNLTLAKHTQLSFFDDLFSVSNRLIATNGRISLVIPYRYLGVILEMAKSYLLYPSKICEVKSFAHKEPFNTMIELTKDQINPLHEELVVYATQKQYSPEYIQHTSELYTIF